MGRVGNPTFVVDCIDNLDTKIDLLRYCRERNLRVISSMGAGGKRDPSRIQVADLSETCADAFCRTLRRELKKHDIIRGIPVVFSTEVDSVKLLPLSDEMAADPESFKTLPQFRIRIMPVLGIPLFMEQ